MCGCKWKISVEDAAARPPGCGKLRDEDSLGGVAKEGREKRNLLKGIRFQTASP
jgi:hypothetical protein